MLNLSSSGMTESQRHYATEPGSSSLKTWWIRRRSWGYEKRDTLYWCDTCLGGSRHFYWNTGRWKFPSACGQLFSQVWYLEVNSSTLQKMDAPCPQLTGTFCCKRQSTNHASTKSNAIFISMAKKSNLSRKRYICNSNEVTTSWPGQALWRSTEFEKKIPCWAERTTKMTPKARESLMKVERRGRAWSFIQALGATS